eukprot:10847-Heterococcus_DN1.PRE.1
MSVLNLDDLLSVQSMSQEADSSISSDSQSCNAKVMDTSAMTKQSQHGTQAPAAAFDLDTVLNNINGNVKLHIVFGNNGSLSSMIKGFTELRKLQRHEKKSLMFHGTKCESLREVRAVADLESDDQLLNRCEFIEKTANCNTAAFKAIMQALTSAQQTKEPTPDDDVITICTVYSKTQVDMHYIAFVYTHTLSRTVHQAKGREWDRVKLGNDFDELLTSRADKLQKELKEKCTCSKIKQQKASSTRPYKSASTQQHPVPSISSITTQSQSVQFTASSQLAVEKCSTCKELLDLKDLPVKHWHHHTPSESREQAACVLFVALTRAKRELKLNSVVDDFLQWVSKRDADKENNDIAQAHIHSTALVHTKGEAALTAGHRAYKQQQQQQQQQQRQPEVAATAVATINGTYKQY